MNQYEVDEYDHFLSREGRDYSPMHQAMYLCIVELLREQPTDILEVGFGIGYGLQKLKEANCIKKYWGIDLSERCYQKVYEENREDDRITLCNGNWLETEIYFNKYDITLCIETIEHMKVGDHLPALKKIYDLTGKIFFMSTPDTETDQHGLLKTSEWIYILKDAGFKNITTLEVQIPHTFYMCSP